MPIIIEESNSLTTDIQINLDLFNHLQEGILLVNGDKEITYINKFAIELSGYTKDSVLGHIINNTLFQFYSQDDNRLNSNQCPIEKSLYNAQDYNNTVYFINNNDQQVFIQLKIMPIEDSESNIIGCFISMAELKDTQELENNYLKLKTKLEESRIIMQKLLETNEMLNDELQ